MSELESEKRLQDHFFYGLKLPLRDSIHYHYEQMEADYDVLIDEAKKEKMNVISTTAITVLS